MENEKTKIQTNPEETPQNNTDTSVDARVEEVAVSTEDFGVPAKDSEQIEQEADPSADASLKETKNTPKGTVRTYKDDVRNLVRGQKLSLAKMVATQERMEPAQIKKNENTNSSGLLKKITIMSIVILFIAIFFVLFSELYVKNSAHDTTRNIIGDFPSVIFTEAQEEIEVNTSTQGLLTRALDVVNTNMRISPGTFIDYILVKRDLDESGRLILKRVLAQEFVQSLNIGSTSIPSEFISSLDDEYIVGMHSLETNVPFIMLSTHAYGYAFSGMISWERTMANDLAPFFGRGVPFDTVTAAIEGNGNFTDDVINNMDVRILRDSQDTVVVVYTFIDRGTILIAGDLRTLSAVASRARTRGTAN